MENHLCIQEGPVFRIRELNSPWRSILHLGQRQVVKKSWQWANAADTFSFLHRGQVRLRNRPEHGKEQILLRIEQGCLFREVPFLHVSPLYPALFEAVEPCEVYDFPRAWLQDPKFAHDYPDLVCNLISSVGIKAGAFYCQLTERAEQSPKALVCRYLHRMMRDRAQPCFNPGISQSNLASHLGLHRSTVCRILKELRESGILGRFTPCNVEILNPEALGALCDIPRVSAPRPASPLFK